MGLWLLAAPAGLGSAMIFLLLRMPATDVGIGHSGDLSGLSDRGLCSALSQLSLKLAQSLPLPYQALGRVER